MDKSKQLKAGLVFFLIAPLLWFASYLVSLFFNLCMEKSVSIISCITTIIFFGYTVFCYKKKKKSKVRDLVLANLIVAGTSSLYFLKAFRIDPEMDILAIIILLVASFLFCIPSIISIPFLLLILLGKPGKRELRFLESPFEIKWLNKFAAKFFSLLGLIVSLFFIAAVITIFWSGIMFPLSWYMVGTFFYFFYWTCLAPVLDLRGNVPIESIIYQAFIDLYAALFGQHNKKA